MKAELNLLKLQIVLPKTAQLPGTVESADCISAKE